MADPTVAIISQLETLADGTLHIQGGFTDNATFRRPFAVNVAGNLTVAQLKDRLIALNSAIDSQAELQKVVTPGSVIDLTPPVPVPPPDPTPAQLFIGLWAQYQSALRKVQARLVAPDAAEVTTLFAQTQAAYDPAFVGLG